MSDDRTSVPFSTDSPHDPELPEGVELYDSYAEMAIANGVDPDDPALIGPAPPNPADAVPLADFADEEAGEDPSPGG
ncbi:DUF6283 family protein [Streptomyces sp. NPDC057654]|uniref:DUF6283 family protein n=1 Tax=Streptomyces sp. NPDC057654 TaxID=3346196 RepID=UPI0036BAF5BA